MPFDGYWEQGGNEVLNRQRAFSYANAASCPSGWLRCGDCPPLAEALGDDEYTDISSAPWYDVHDERSHRFLGAYPLTLESHSPRTATITEGILDGGVIQGTRRGVRQVRATALLMGEGRDAVDYGLAWLNAALDPEDCSGHGSACGEVDACFFADCPPARGMIPIYTDWTPVAFGLATNPSFETAGAVPVTVRNLATNPSFETTGGAVEVHRNLITNPSLETASGTVEMRRNLVTNPAMTTNATGWLAYGAGVVARATDQYYDTVASLKLTNTVGGQVGAQMRSLPVTAGTTYTAQAQVYARAGVSPTQISLRWYNGTTFLSQTDSDPRELPARWDLMSVTGVAPATATLVDVVVWMPAAVAADVRYIDRVMLEASPIVASYFDGGHTSSDSDLTVAWAGAANASASVVTGPAAAGIAQSALGASRGIQSAKNPQSGSKSLRIIPVPHPAGSNDSFVYVGAVANLIGVLEAGKTYTVLATLQVPAVQTGTPHADARRIRVNQDAGAATSAQSPNAIGTYEHRLTFTVAPGATTVSIRLYNGGAYGSTDVFWDKLLVVEGQYDGPYFDGSTSGDADLTVAWAGTPHASASVATGTKAAEPVPGSAGAVGTAVVRSTKWQSMGLRSLRIIPKTESADTFYQLGAAGSTAFFEKGKTYTVLATLRLAAPQAGIGDEGARTITFVQDVAGVPQVVRSAASPNTAGEHEHRLTFTVDPAATGAYVRLYNGASGGNGDAWWDDLLITEGNYVGPYFDGSSPPPDQGLTSAWTGVAHASASVATAQSVAGVTSPAGALAYQSALRSTLGSYSLAVPGNATADAYALPSIPLSPSTTYTVLGTITLTATGADVTHARSIALAQGGIVNSMAAPNIVGSHRVRHTFTTGPTGTPELRLYGNGDTSTTVYWDELQVVATEYDGPYFDGDSAPTIDEFGEEIERYRWTGAEHGSISRHEVRARTTVTESDEQYADRVDTYRLQLHGVVTISGPIITQTFHRDRFWAYLVEFTVAAANPYIFSVPRQIENQHIPSGVVQDTPYNLIPYPSAELADATAVLMTTNFSPNPSLENNDTAWQGLTEHVSGSTPPGVSNKGRQQGGDPPALVNQGVASMRAALIAPSSGTATGDAYLTIYQDVPLTGTPPVPAGARMSFSVWAALRVNNGVAPGTVIRSLTADVQWKDASSVTQRTDVFGSTSTDLAGVTFGAKSLVPALTAVTARVRVRALVTWSASATPANKTDVDLYVDTLSATVP